MWLAPAAHQRRGLRLPREARRQVEAALLGRSGLGPLLQGARARALPVAERDRRRRAADQRPDGAARGRGSTGAVRTGARCRRGWGEGGLERPQSLCLVGPRRPGLVGSGMSGALPSDPAELRAMIAALEAESARMAATLRAHELLVQSLRARIGPGSSGCASGRAPRRSSARSSSSSWRSKTSRWPSPRGTRGRTTRAATRPRSRPRSRSRGVVRASRTARRASAA